MNKKRKVTKCLEHQKVNINVHGNVYGAYGV